jgi:hypothetical protein
MIPIWDGKMIPMDPSKKSFQTVDFNDNFKYIYIYTVPLHSRYYPMKSPAPTAPVSLAETGSPHPPEGRPGSQVVVGIYQHPEAQGSGHAACVWASLRSMIILRPKRGLEYKGTQLLFELPKNY